MGKRKSKNKNSIGRREWVIMRFITDNHPIGVREVAEFMLKERGLARTSVLSVMERLREKGFLKRERSANRWVYSPKKKSRNCCVVLFLSLIHI